MSLILWSPHLAPHAEGRPSKIHIAWKQSTTGMRTAHWNEQDRIEAAPQYVCVCSIITGEAVNQWRLLTADTDSVTDYVQGQCGVVDDASSSITSKVCFKLAWWLTTGKWSWLGVEILLTVVIVIPLWTGILKTKSHKKVKIIIPCWAK